MGAQVGELMPRRVKKRRKIETEDGSDQGWEEYFDYIFPEDEAAKPNLKLLAMAKMWKKKKETTDDDPEEENEDVEISAENGEDATTAENIDADDPDIVNESSSSSDEDEEKKDVSEKSKADSSDDGAEGDAKKRKLES